MLRVGRNLEISVLRCLSGAGNVVIILWVCRRLLAVICLKVVVTRLLQSVKQRRTNLASILVLVVIAWASDLSTFCLWTVCIVVVTSVLC